MITVNISGHVPNFGALPKQLEAARDKSIKRAQQDTLRSLRTQIVREVVGEYYLKPGQVRPVIQIAPPVLRVRSERLSLDKYKLSPKSPGRRKKILTAGVKRAGGLKPLPHAFLVNIHGSWKPFVRKGSSRLPINVLLGPSIAQLPGGDTLRPRLEEHAAQIFPRRLEYWWGVNTGKLGVK